MSETRFTPGPWSVGPYRAGGNDRSKLRGTIILGPGDEKRSDVHLALALDEGGSNLLGVAVVSPHPGVNAATSKANALLIATAPDMIDALRQWAWAEKNGDEQELQNARTSRDSAIAKALGVQP